MQRSLRNDDFTWVNATAATAKIPGQYATKAVAFHYISPSRARFVVMEGL